MIRLPTRRRIFWPCEYQSSMVLGLLRRFARYRALFSRGHLTRIGLPDSVDSALARLDTAVVGVANDLSVSTPPSQRVRLEGRLDVMGVSKGVLKMALEPGVVVSAACGRAMALSIG